MKLAWLVYGDGVNEPPTIYFEKQWERDHYGKVVCIVYAEVCED